MERKKGLRGAFALAFVFLLLSIPMWMSAGGKKEVQGGVAAPKIRLAVGDPIQSSVGTSARYFAQEVSESAGNRIPVEVFADGILFGGDQNAAVNMVRDSSLDSTILSTSVYASFEMLFDIP